MLVAQRDWSAFIMEEDFDLKAGHAQMLFLQDAMDRLELSKEAFAVRIGVSKKCLSKWMSAPSSAEFRHMPHMGWKFITEILEKAATEALGSF